MYVIDRRLARLQQQQQQLDGLDGFFSNIFKKVIKPVAGVALAVTMPSLGVPLLLAQQQAQAQKKAAEAAQRQADEAARLLGSPAVGSVPSGDVAMARALAAQAAAASVGSVPSGDVALRRAMGGEDPDERSKRLLMWGAIAAGGLVAVAAIASIASRRD